MAIAIQDKIEDIKIFIYTSLDAQEMEIYTIYQNKDLLKPTSSSMKLEAT